MALSAVSARRLAALALLALLASCATADPARWPGWTTLRSGPLALRAPADLSLVSVGENRFFLERAEGLPLMEARLSPWCPDSAEPGARLSFGRFASPLSGAALGGEDRFFSIVTGPDECLLLRFYGLYDAQESREADRIAASVTWAQ